MLAQTLNLPQVQANAFGSSVLPTSIGDFIGKTLPYIFGAAGIALLIYLILGGFQLMTSRGDPKAAQSAQAKITNAVIGFIVVIFAFFIVQIFGLIFGIKGTAFGQIFGLK